MDRGPINNVAALTALARRYEAITQDLANAATPGYRRRVAGDTAFSSALNGMGLGAELRVDVEPGPLQRTGNPLDLALGGPGFLAVQGPTDQVLLTRRGDLEVRDGVLHLRGGPPVLGRSGPISVPSSLGGVELSISEDGRIMSGSTEVGELRLVSGESLSPRGKGLYAAEKVQDLSGPERPSVAPAMREGSNVNLSAAMAELISTNRLYTTNLGALRQLDSLDQRLLRIRPV